jgi:hypothetical protein
MLSTCSHTSLRYSVSILSVALFICNSSLRSSLPSRPQSVHLAAVLRNAFRQLQSLIKFVTLHRCPSARSVLQNRRQHELTRLWVLQRVFYLRAFPFSAFPLEIYALNNWIQRSASLLHFVSIFLLICRIWLCVLKVKGPWAHTATAVKILCYLTFWNAFFTFPVCFNGFCNRNHDQTCRSNDRPFSKEHLARFITRRALLFHTNVQSTPQTSFISPLTYRKSKSTYMSNNASKVALN